MILSVSISKQECSASGSADDVPETTSTGTEASSCDLTGWFGQITGTYNLEITSGSKD